MVCLGRPYHFKFFKDCLPQILLGPFLNTLTQIEKHCWDQTAETLYLKKKKHVLTKFFMDNSNAYNEQVCIRVHDFFTPRRRQKTKVFLTFSGGLEMENWVKLTLWLKVTHKMVSHIFTLFLPGKRNNRTYVK